MKEIIERMSPARNCIMNEKNKWKLSTWFCIVNERNKRKKSLTRNCIVNEIKERKSPTRNYCILRYMQSIQWENVLWNQT